MFREDLNELLDSRQKQLEGYVRSQRRGMKNAPEGRLRVSSSDGRTQFYQYLGPEKKQRYIRDSHKVEALAQKMYREDVLSAAEKELNQISKIRKNYPIIAPEDLYDLLSEERREIVTPIQPTDAQYAEEWAGYEYTGRGFRDNQPDYITDKGERVRSKSELLIANYLNSRNIPYRYECPIVLAGYITIYPDFMILNVRRRREYIHEHFGMMDDPVYAQGFTRKIRTYEENGIYPGDKLIFTVETREQPFSMEQFRKIVEKYYL